MAGMYNDYLTQRRGPTPYTTRPAALTSGMPGVLPATLPNPAPQQQIDPTTGLPFAPAWPVGMGPAPGTTPPAVTPPPVEPPPDPRLPRPEGPAPYEMPRPFMRTARQVGNPGLFDPYANTVNAGRQMFTPQQTDPNAPPPNRSLVPPWQQGGQMGQQYGVQPEDPRDRMMREKFPRASAFHDTLMRRQMQPQQPNPQPPQLRRG